MNLNLNDCVKCVFMRRTDPEARCPRHNPNWRGTTLPKTASEIFRQAARLEG